MKRPIRHLLLLGLAGAVMMQVFTFGSDVAHAGGGAVGSSGSGGASSGGYYTYYNPGWGWRNYSVTDSGPPGGFLNGTWGAAQAACSGYSTNILVFTLSSSTGVLAGRDYKTIYYSPATYQKYNSTGAYVSVPTAQAAYNALPASIRGSSVFGSNVGWFCYGIIPQVNFTMSGLTTVNTSTASPGSIVTFHHEVKNNGPNTATGIWYDTQASDAGGAYYQKKPGTGPYTIAPGATVTTDQSFTIPAGATAGTVYCQRVGYQPTSSSDGTYNNGSGACVLVANSPYVVAVGGDVWAGGSTISPYSGSGSLRGTATSSLGSFGEYSVFATDTVSYFGSGGVLGASSSSTGNAAGPLTFANATGLGSFSTAHRITNLSLGSYASAVHTAGVLSGGQIAASGVYKASSDVTINASTLAPGMHSVIYAPNNTVTIAGDITYNSTGVSSFSQVPSLVVVAKNIQVNGAVQRIDASLYATDSFASCTEGPRTIAASVAITTSGTCSKALVINGSLSVAKQAAGSTVFNRSFGGQTTGQPAETIKMRPEVFLTTYDLTSQPGSSILRTVQETEMPARY